MKTQDSDSEEKWQDQELREAVARYSVNEEVIIKQELTEIKKINNYSNRECNL